MKRGEGEKKKKRKRKRKRIRREEEEFKKDSKVWKLTLSMEIMKISIDLWNSKVLYG